MSIPAVAVPAVCNMGKIMIDQPQLGLLVTVDGRSEWRFADATPRHISEEKDSAFFIGPASGSEMGVFANRAIKRGERLIAEAPLLQWILAPGDKTNAGLIALVNALDPSARQLYDNLSQNEHAHGAHKSIYGIWLTNALVATPAGLEPHGRVLIIVHTHGAYDRI